MSLLADNSIHAWIEEHEIKNEKGDRIDFVNHLFLFDIYCDQSQNLVVMKPAQAGLSTLEILKNFYDGKHQKMDIIYTLPTDQDVSVFVGGKVNRIIAVNPILQSYTADKDTIEQKQIGDSMVYFRGTWTKKAAIMITADRLVHDEKDSSKQDVIADFKARLQHSKFKQIHTFSHPSVPNNGVHSEWLLSDQKEWIIKCPHCTKLQYLTWDTEDPKKMSVDIERQEFVCKKCGGILSDHDRAVGEWYARKPGAEWSGYHISLLMCPWVTAKEIIKKHQEVLDGKQTMDFFYNKVLGLPFAGSGNSVNEEDVMGLWTEEKNLHQGRMVIGVDTGIFLRYVIGNKQGLLGYGQMKDYEPYEPKPGENPNLRVELKDSLEYFLTKFPDSIMVIDQGGDIIGSRKLQKKYPGRVFLCHYSEDRKSMQLIRWGEKKEYGQVLADRNRMLQLVIDEMRNVSYHLYSKAKNDWHDYWLHWSHIYRVVVENERGVMTYKWFRSDRDDWCHATVYWRIGIDKFGGKGEIVNGQEKPEPNSYFVNTDQTVSFNPEEMFKLQGLDEVIDDEWR